ncbi:DsbA family protein [bacterium]|nr:DsbA family protein [bacterium]
MTQVVEIFYSFQCPYSYLGIDRLSQLEQKFDVRVLWQPFSAKAAGQAGPSATYSPERANYIREDVVRLAKRMELPLVMRADWPEKEPDPERSTRGAVIAGDMGLSMEYNIKMFDCWWGTGEDPNDQAFLIQLCDELDVDPGEFLAKLSSHDTRERVRGLYKRGRKLMVFDTPMIMIGEERYQGIDRIAMAEERLTEMGLKRSRTV